MRTFLTIWLTTLLLSDLLAQVTHLNRYETEHQWNNQDYLVVSNEHKGILLVKPLIPGAGKNATILLTHLSTDLKETWTSLVEIPKRFFLKGYHYIDDVTYLLFQNRSSNQIVKIVAINPFDQTIEEFEPKQIVDIEIYEFEVLKGSAIIGGYYESRPVVFAYDMKNDRVRTLANVYQNNSELLEVRINSDSLTFNVLASQLDDKKDRTILVNTYDYVGNAIRDYELQTVPDHQLLSAVSSSINDKAQIVAGLYSVKTGTYPSGIFVNHVSRTGEQTMKYMNFGEFETFLNHNGEKRSNKLKQRALEAKKSKREWRYKTDALFREMVEEDDKLLIVGEFFKPWNISTTNYQRQRNQLSPFSYAYDPFFDSSLPITRTTQDFRNNGLPNDFNFTHAFALVIDQNGEILWDGSFDIDETVDGPLMNFGEFQWHNDQAYYSFYHDEELVVKHLNNQEIETGFVTEVDLMEPKDELRYERKDFRGVTRWYDNRYLVYGIQHIRPSDKSSQLRKVFFVNAVTVGPEFEASKLD